MLTLSMLATSLTPRLAVLRRPAAVAVAGRSLAMSAFLGPRQVDITDKLTKAFSPLHMEVLNESHGRKEDECALQVLRLRANVS